MINAKERFFREYYTRYVKDGNMTLEDAVEIEATLSPILNYFVTWEACFEAGLCDVQAGLKFVCERANAHQQIIEQTSSVIDYEPGEILNQYYSSLLKRCFNN
jgi:hypothetical protein